MSQENQTVEIAKEFRWEMGHRLPYHKGGCRNLHGHSYRLRLVVCGTLDENGMVVDYFDLNDIVNPIVERVDHAFLCDENDKEMLDVLKSMGVKHVSIPFPSTAENMARWFAEQIASSLGRYKNLSLLRVRLFETERSYADVSRNL